MNELDDRELYKQTLKKKFLEGKDISDEQTQIELKLYLSDKMAEYDKDNK